MITEENCQNNNDEEIVRLAKSDSQYFYCLMKRYEERLLRYILRITNINFQDAEDLLQEVFIKIYRNLNDFDQDLKFSSWAYRITHNHVISSYRHRKNRPEISEASLEEGALLRLVSDHDQEISFDRENLARKVRQAIDSLDDKYRNVLVLKYFEERDYKEIADIIKIPMGTVATQINRAKKRFEKKFRDIYNL